MLTQPVNMGWYINKKKKKTSWCSPWNILWTVVLILNYTQYTCKSYVQYNGSSAPPLMVTWMCAVMSSAATLGAVIVMHTVSTKQSETHIERFMTTNSAKEVICVERSFASKEKPGTQINIWTWWKDAYLQLWTPACGSPFWVTPHLVHKPDGGTVHVPGVNVWNCVEHSIAEKKDLLLVKLSRPNEKI